MTPHSSSSRRRKPQNVAAPQQNLDHIWTSLLKCRDRLNEHHASGIELDYEITGLIATAWKNNPDWLGWLRNQGITRTARSANTFQPAVRFVFGPDRTKAAKVTRIANTLTEWAETAEGDPAEVAGWIRERGGFEGVDKARRERLTGPKPTRDDQREAFHNLVELIGAIQIPTPEPLQVSDAFGFHNVTVYVDRDTGMTSIIAVSDPLDQNWLTRNAERLVNDFLRLHDRRYRAAQRPKPNLPEVIYLPPRRAA